METKHTDVISRLETAVSAWSDELQSAHLDLERRLADAASKLATEVEGGLLDTSPIIEAIESSTARMDNVHSAIGVVADHVRGMEQRLGAFEGGGGVNSVISELTQRVDQLAEQVESNADGQQLKDEIAELRFEFKALGGDANLNAMRAEIQELKDQIKDAKPIDEALVAEFAKVGMEVSQLRSALKEIGINQDSGAPPSIDSPEEMRVLRAVDDDAVRMDDVLPSIDSSEETPLLGDVDDDAVRMDDVLPAFDSSDKTPVLSDVGDDAGGMEDVFPFREPERSAPVEKNFNDDSLKRLAFDESGHRRRLGDILTAANAITDGQLDDALNRQSSLPTSRIGTILVELGAVTELTIARVLSAQLQLPYAELNDEAVSDEAIALMNPRLARLHQCIPVRVSGDTVTLAMANPLDLIAIEDVELATQKRVDPVVATQSQVAHCIDQFYGPHVDVVEEDGVEFDDES